jgi:uncharacterized protein YggU (UPF0235/DUF167 family)
MADGALKIAVTAAPEGGRANEAVTKLVAGALGLSSRALTIERGARSRSKVIEVHDVNGDEVRRRLDAALGE